MSQKKMRKEVMNMYDENNNLGVYSGYQSNGPEQSDPKKKPKKKSSFFTKAGASIAFGLLFGISASISFYAIRSVAEVASSGLESTSDAAASKLQEALQTAEEMVQNNASQTPNTGVGTGASAAQTVPVTTVTDVTGVVENVMPSVVSITNRYIDTQYYYGREAESSGSGIIIGENDNELLIVTNYHVMQDANTLMIQFIDNEQVEAQIKGTNANMDLAVLAVQRSDIKQSTLNAISIAKLGDSGSLQVGEPAIAIGNALGYGQSVTVGVISAVDRNVEMDGITGTFIQTDAAINPGNSGGALLNMQGEVIGINSNKIGGTVIEGMGYAIPISSAQPILEDLMTKTTKVRVEDSEKGFIGISGVNVTEEVSSAYNMPQGVYVSQVYEGTAAAAAGIIKGDIITKFDGNEVTDMESLQKLLNYYAAGTAVEVVVMQASPTGYTEKTVTVTLGNQTATTQTQ